MPFMKFSIIIPLYNKESYVADTIQSVLNQSFDDYEIIVVDDGSQDNSVEVVKQFSDSRIKLTQQKNAGVSNARNRGISQANGKWICFLDADDWFHPEYLSSLDMSISCYPTLNVFASSFISLADSIEWKPKAWEVSSLDYEIIENLPNRWIRGIPFFTSSICIKKSLLAQMQPCFPPGESSGEDIDLWFRIAEKEKILLITNPLVAYRTEVKNSLVRVATKSLESPFIKRMLNRAETLDNHLKKSTIKMVVHYYCAVARDIAYTNGRLKSLKTLASISKYGLFEPRFWFTLFMLFLFPVKLVTQWQRWRELRTIVKIKS